MRRFPILRTLLPFAAALTAVLAAAHPVIAAPAPEPRKYLVVTDPVYAQKARDMMTSLSLTNDGIGFADLAAANPETLRANYRAIYVPVHLSTGPGFDALRSLVGTGGVLERFVNGGGTLVLNVGAFGGTVQLDIAPGGVDYDGGMPHKSELVTMPDHPYFTGAGYGGARLSRGDFGNWLPTDLGRLVGLPTGAAILLVNSDGPALSEYRWGRGRVLLSTLTLGRPGFPSRVGRAWTNLLRYGAWVPPFTAYGGAAPEKVAPTITITNRGPLGQLLKGPNGRSAYVILVKDASPSSGLVEVKVEGVNYAVVAVNGTPVASLPLPYTDKFAVGSGVTQWEVLVERISLRAIGSLRASAADAAGNKVAVSR